MHATTKAKATGSNTLLDSGSVTKRLQQELMSIMCAGDSSVSAFPSGDSLLNWIATIQVCFRLFTAYVEYYFAHFNPALWPIPVAHFEFFSIYCLCQGPSGTAYEGLSFRLGLTFTSEYPFKAPVVKFETPCFHPNVDLQGNICLDILKEKWSGKENFRRKKCNHRCLLIETLLFTTTIYSSIPSIQNFIAAAYSVTTILQSIQSLLGDANVDSPLNVHAAKLWDLNQAEYKDLVLKAYKSKPTA